MHDLSLFGALSYLTIASAPTHLPCTRRADERHVIALELAWFACRRPSSTRRIKPPNAQFLPQSDPESISPLVLSFVLHSRRSLSPCSALHLSARLLCSPPLASPAPSGRRLRWTHTQAQRWPSRRAPGATGTSTPHCRTWVPPTPIATLARHPLLPHATLASFSAVTLCKT